MAEEISDTSPNRQAYTQLAKEGYKGRFAANIADIRLFKDNPYIKDLDQADRLELNRYCPRCKKHTTHKEKK